MVPLNILTFNFSPSKIFFRLLVSLKFSIYEINPYFLLNSCLTFIFFNEISQKRIEYYDNLYQKKSNFLTKHELNMNFNVFGAKKFILNSCYEF